MKTEAMKKSYGGRLVLDLPQMEIEAGKIYAVVGANGSGKSTFAKILAGALSSDTGAGTVKTEALGYMPQRSYAFRMSLVKNLLLCAPNPQRARELMEALGLSALADKPAQKLSGGETAKMALARVLMRDCSLLVLDEPTAAMDMESTLQAEELIKQYRNQTGCAVVWITHSLQQAKRSADETLFFSCGRLCEAGPTEQLLTNPQKDETRRFIDFYGL